MFFEPSGFVTTLKGNVVTKPDGCGICRSCSPEISDSSHSKIWTVESTFTLSLLNLDVHLFVPFQPSVQTKTVFFLP